jgi:Na+/melibiose symporter-like transporter
VRRNRLALLLALGVDNFGSGLFLPLALLYVTQVVGLPLGTAGTAVALGAVAGVAVPPVAGRLVDRVGPRSVVITAQLLQAAGAGTYLVADGAGPVVLGAVLLAAGQQMFYSSLFTLIADVSAAGPQDRPFALVGMVRSASFGVGSLLVGGLLTAAGPVGYRAAVAADAASFLGCALVLALCVRVPHRPRELPEQQDGGARTPSVLANRVFLALIAITGLMALASDFFLAGIPVYTVEEVKTPPWLPGAIIAVQTTVTSTAGTLALRVTRRLARTTAMALGASVIVVWCGANLAALVIPAAWRAAELLAATLILATGALLSGPRANAMAVAIAPAATRGRYLAAFQYAFTIPGVLAPAVVAAFSLAVWLPWLIVATGAGIGGYALLRLGRRLPAHAVHPQFHQTA